MKQRSLLKRFGILLLALLMAAMFLFTGCEAEDVDLALDIADAVLDMALDEDAEPTTQENKAPESSQSPPAETTPPMETAPSAETPSEEEAPAETPAEENTPEETIPDEDGRYTTAEDVAAYIHHYGKLPKNFITKNEAKDLGWDNSKGNLWEVTDEMSIGGDHFGNYEGKLPDAGGRTWRECDINYSGGYRGAERIVYSNDGLIYYTNDHYETFTQLY